MLAVAASCPGCGAKVPVPAAATAVRCESCGSAHLVLSGGGPLAARLAARTTPGEAAALARAALADEMRRRGRAGPEPEAGEPVAFEAPVRVLLARLHEAAVVRGPAGDPAASVTARLSDAARSALEGPLALGTAPSPGEVDPAGLALVPRGAVVAPPFDAGEAAFEEDARRLAAAATAREPVLARRVVAFPLSRLLVLRPALLVPVSSGQTRAAVLVDAASRQAVALLSAGALEALRASLAPRALPAAAPPALRPMRCPACASPFPLDREGPLRLCPACRRAHVVAGRRLLPVAYEAELPPSPRARLLVPAFRFRFALTDPRDGAELTSLAAVRARCGDPRVAVPEGPAPFDVPAFLPADRRRERRGGQYLPVLPEAAFPFFEGPARAEAGFPDVRTVAALGPGEAADVLRHALLAALPPRVVALAAPRRLKALLLEAPLRAGPPRLVLRALPRAEAEAS